jgi:hypothetical protein
MSGKIGVASGDGGFKNTARPALQQLFGVHKPALLTLPPFQLGSSLP